MKKLFLAFIVAIGFAAPVIADMYEMMRDLIFMNATIEQMRKEWQQEEQVKQQEQQELQESQKTQQKKVQRRISKNRLAIDMHNISRFSDGSDFKNAFDISEKKTNDLAAHLVKTSQANRE